MADPGDSDRRRGDDQAGFQNMKGAGPGQGTALKVFYIAGCGRSGSTLLGHLLGQLEGFTTLGEIPYLWDRSLRDNRLCGCGRPFAECRLWQPVVARALGQWTSQDLTEMIAVRDRLTPWAGGPGAAAGGSRGCRDGTRRS